MIIFLNHTTEVEKDLNSAAENLTWSSEVSYTIREVVTPVLSKYDQDMIEKSNAQVMKKNRKSKSLHLGMGIPMVVLGAGSVLASICDIPTDYSEMQALCMILGGVASIVGGGVISCSYTTYNNYKFRQEIYRKYPEAQEVLADAKQASNLLKKIIEPNNYSK